MIATLLLERRQCLAVVQVESVMKVTFENSTDYRDFLGAEFDDIAGSSTDRELRFSRGVQFVEDVCNDLDLDLDDGWIEGEELQALGFIRH